MKGYKVAVVGATGLVGQELIKILAQRHFPMSSLHLFASDRSAGKKVKVNSEEIQVKATEADSFEEIDVAFFYAGADASRYFAPAAVRAGAVVIDGTTNSRTLPGVPLVVPEVNAGDIKGHRGVIACPGSATIPLVTALYPLHRVSPIRRVVVSTYQSVSGTGSAAVDELMVQSRQVLDGQTAVPHAYPHQIAFNLLPETDVFLDNGYTKEEWRIVDETRRVMHSESISISATCVRVPVVVGDSMAVHVEFAKPVQVEDATRVLSNAPGVKVLDEGAVSLYPQPWPAAGNDEVFVGRIRRDTSQANGLVMWIVTDNLRKGSALNAVQIAEEMTKRGWLHPGS